MEPLKTNVSIGNDLIAAGAISQNNNFHSEKFALTNNNNKNRISIENVMNIKRIIEI